MPALPWVQRPSVDPDREYLAMASQLPLKSHLSIPGFLRDTMRIRAQLGTTPGLVGYGLYAQLARKVFWTFSLWDDQASLDTFAASEPHHRIIGRLRPRMGEARFNTFALLGRDLPATWDQRTARVR